MIPHDDLNRFGVLNRRAIEARILAPFVEALSEKLPREMEGASHCDFRYRTGTADTTAALADEK